MARNIRRIVDLFCDIIFWVQYGLFDFIKSRWDDLYQKLALSGSTVDLMDILEEHKILRAGKNGTIASFNLRRLLIVANPYTAGMVIGSFLKSCPLELLEGFERLTEAVIPTTRMVYDAIGPDDLVEEERRGMAVYIVVQLRRLYRKNPDVISEIISGIYKGHPVLATQMEERIYFGGNNALYVFDSLEKM